MSITKKQLNNAVAAQIISQDQANQLLTFFQNQSENTANFTFTHVLYYVGGLIAIGAMTLFMNVGWESFGGAGIVFISMIYAAIGLLFTHYFAAKNLSIPAGICATFVVCLTPLTIYGIQQCLGIWPDDSHYQDYHRYIKWNWLYMELGTLITGIIVAWKYKYPFLIMPIAITLWYMSMDIAVFISDGDFNWELRKLVSLYSGLLMIALAFWVDIRSRHKDDYAFWIYIFGAIAFWGGLSSQHSDNEISKLLYFSINLLMMVIGVILNRRIFLVLGTIGGSSYLGYLASDIFKDSWLFPIALSAIGLSIIYFGIFWQKHEIAITKKSRLLLPTAFRELLEARS